MSKFTLPFLLLHRVLLLPHLAQCTMQPVRTLKSPPHYQSNHWYEPFIVHSNWPAMSKWNIEYFATEFPHTGPVRIGTMPRRNTASSIKKGTIPYSLSISKSQSVLNFSAACRLILESSSNNDQGHHDDDVHYVYQLPTASLLNEEQWVGGEVLRPDINFGDLRSIDRSSLPPPHHDPPKKLNHHFEESFIWIGGNGTRSGLHFDMSDNYHVVVTGAKTVVLFPPRDAPFLYPLGDVPIQSQIDPLHVDVLQNYPLFARTRPQLVHLVPGDALFIPRLWWHWVESTDVTISVNWWHYPPLWWRHMYNTNSIKQRQKAVLTEYLDKFRFIHMNPKKMKLFHRAAGDAGVCRSWYAVAHGFVQYALTRLYSSNWRSMNQPRTLVEKGAAFAERLVKSGVLLLENDVEKGGGVVDLNRTWCRDDDPVLKYVDDFRTQFRDGVVKSLLKKMSRDTTGMLKEEDLLGSLMSSVVLVETFEPRPTKGCHFDQLFVVNGGGEAWQHCEELTSVVRVDVDEL